MPTESRSGLIAGRISVCRKEGREWALAERDYITERQANVLPIMRRSPESYYALIM